MRDLQRFRRVLQFQQFRRDTPVRLDFYKAVTGLELTPEEWSRTKALRILQLQRAMLLLGGSDIKWNPKTDDDNPPRLYEPLRSGPYKGKTAEKAKVKEDKKMYYKQAGWDTSGIPKSETLRKLGLNDVDKTLDKIRH